MALHPRDFEKILPGEPGRRAVSIRWLGTAGYELVCDGVTLLIDPYLTRVSLRQFAFGRLRPDLARIQAEIRGADAILVGHSHFDHVMDVPAIAQLTGARVYGSRSTANLMKAAGLPDAQVVECAGGEIFEVGPFRVRMVPSVHSKFLFGRVPYEGEIPCSCEIPMRGSDYRCGQVFSLAVTVDGRTIYHAGSADLIDDQIAERDVDLVLMCIAARFYTDRFIPRLLDKLRPRVVMPTHYDNLFRSADRPMTLLPKIAFGEFVDEVHGFDRQIEIATIPIGGTSRMDL
jgi:L-ascorbate metabolism protein UlaG (beta-lactamase superfamily)